MKNTAISDKSHKQIKLLALNKSIELGKYISHSDILDEIIDYYFKCFKPKMPLSESDNDKPFKDYQVIVD
jgi:hypothetical protein